MTWLMLIASSQAISAQDHLRVDKNRMCISLLTAKGDTLMNCPISCGRGFGPKQKQGDMRTPEGVYSIVSFTDAREWGHDFKDGKGYIQHAYGPWFIRLSAGNGIGIHGTHDPESMGIRASEGCIRLRNQDLSQLKPQLKVGMRVEITSDSFPPIFAPSVNQLVVEEGKMLHNTCINMKL